MRLAFGIIVGFVVCMSGKAIADDDESKVPDFMPPQPCLARIVGEDRVELKRFLSDWDVNATNHESPWILRVFAVDIEISCIKATWLDGTEIPADELRAALSKSDLVIAYRQGDFLDPRFLRLFQQDLLLLEIPDTGMFPLGPPPGKVKSIYPEVSVLKATLPAIGYITPEQNGSACLHDYIEQWAEGYSERKVYGHVIERTCSIGAAMSRGLYPLNQNKFIVTRVDGTPISKEELGKALAEPSPVVVAYEGFPLYEPLLKAFRPTSLLIRH